MGDERDLRPVKGKSPMWEVGVFTFAPNRAHHAGKANPGCRLTPFALPWAMDSLGFQPVTPLSPFIFLISPLIPLCGLFLLIR